MNITKPQVKQILKTLPIGYYINRDVKIELSDELGSYYLPMEDRISISYPMLAQVSQNLPEDDTLENDIRCLLYHEISHAFITPKELRSDNIINIFEDERIESILRNYYRGVKFREFVKRVNNFNGQKPRTADELFYQIVRFRIGPSQFLDRVHELILKYESLTNAYWLMYDYKEDVYNLYNDIKDYFNEQTQKEQSQSQNSNDSNEDGQTQSSNENQTSEEDEENESNLNDSDDSSNDTDKIEDRSEEDEENFSKEAGQQHVDKIVDKYESKDISDEVEKILSSVKHQTKQNGSAINAYSGVFNPRSVVRNDYKYFVQQNRVGHVKAYSQIHLNLFIDCSSSFESNDDTVNKLLKALIKFEKSNSNFSFDLISCGVGQRIRAKNDRFQKSYDGTLITEQMIEQYKQVQVPNAQNINICLYDGDAIAWYGRRKSLSSKIQKAIGFSAFNNRNSILIVDESNRLYVERHCPNAKCIITHKYVEELQKNVLQALQALTR